MRDAQYPDQTYFHAQFAGVQARIAKKVQHRRRRTRWMFAGIGAVTSLALTGGAIAVIQATEAQKSASLCYGSASLASASTEVSQPPTDGIIGQLPEMTQRIANAEAQCGVAWQIGAFTPEGSSDDTNLPVPNLFTCLLRDGRLGVFPVTDGIDCAGLGLKAP